MASSPRTPPAARSGDDVRRAERRPSERADVIVLLRCYREAIELAADPPPSRRARFSLLTRLLTRLRPTWGLRRMVVEHVRARIALLERDFARRLALGERDDNDTEDREKLSLFAASLPPSRSRIWAAVPLLAVVAVSQTLLALLLRSQDRPSQTKAGVTDPERILPKDVLEALTSVADLNPANLAKTVGTLLDSSPKVTALVVGLLTLSIYIVWRPLLPAYRLKRIILGAPGAIGRRCGRSELGVRAQQLGVHGEEVALFAALGVAPPRDPDLDLRVKSALVAILGALAVLMFLPPALPTVGIVLLTLAVARLWWLMRERKARG